MLDAEAPSLNAQSEFASAPNKNLPQKMDTVNRQYTKRSDVRIKEIHVLLRTFIDGGDIIPVQIEIKEYKSDSGMDNKLYVTITAKKKQGSLHGVPVRQQRLLASVVLLLLRLV